jgi:LEA14-like dessication related protein
LVIAEVAAALFGLRGAAALGSREYSVVCVAVWFARRSGARENAQVRTISGMRLSPIAVAAGCMIGMSCAALGPMTPPRITLVDLELTEMTLFETAAELTVRISNPNPEALVVTGSAFELFLDGFSVGRAMASERVDVPRLGTATQVAELRVSNVALVARLAKILEQPEPTYRIKTELWVERAYGSRKVRLDHRGRLDTRVGGGALLEKARVDTGGVE